MIIDMINKLIIFILMSYLYVISMLYLYVIIEFIEICFILLYIQVFAIVIRFDCLLFICLRNFYCLLSLLNVIFIFRSALFIIIDFLILIVVMYL